MRPRLRGRRAARRARHPLLRHRPVRPHRGLPRHPPGLPGHVADADAEPGWSRSDGTTDEVAWVPTVADRQSGAVAVLDVVTYALGGERDRDRVHLRRAGLKFGSRRQREIGRDVGSCAATSGGRRGGSCSSPTPASPPPATPPGSPSSMRRTRARGRGLRPGPRRADRRLPRGSAIAVRPRRADPSTPSSPSAAARPSTPPRPSTCCSPTTAS